MNEIDKSELTEILDSYGIKDLIFATSKRVGPDTMIYIFYDKDNNPYILLAADFLGGYGEIVLPHDFEFDDDYPYTKVKFTAIRNYSYLDNAPKAAKSSIDDKHLWTSASTGDICMLFGCSNIVL